jgi:hypothetical protein
MDEKYPELVQFFRDNGNTSRKEQNLIQLQKGINEHQYFAKLYSDIKYVLNFDPESLDGRVREKLSPKQLSVMNH